jgi:hypothetical protein
MAIQIEQPNTPVAYVPESEDADDPNRAEFQLVKLRARDKAKIRDGMVGLNKKGRVNKFKSNQVSLNLVLEQLAGWQGIVDATGAPVDFNPKDPEESFDYLPDEIQDELMEKFGSAGADEDEEEDADEEDVEDEDAE